MENNLVAKAGIYLEAPVTRVWEALTHPDQVKEYFFGTQLISDWKAGSSLIWRGEWEGKIYEDKGIILDIENNKRLRYTYFSSMSDLEDIPENYNTITYDLLPSGSGTTLEVTQENVRSEEVKEHSEQNWSVVLEGLKKYLAGN